jgi:hypothetical protein
MKKLLTLTALIGATTISFAQGTVNFANSATTLISAGGVTMSNSNQFNFAVFLAPSSTAASSGQTAGLNDAAFQTVAGSTANNPNTAGRLTSKSGLDVGGAAGNVVDFVVRGWSANAGATWLEALAAYNANTPGIWIGTSTIGNDLTLGGGAIPPTTLFGAGGNQVGGFNLVQIVPEPTSMVLAGLGAASLLLFRRRE